jgi:DNA-damage-inducible protein J
MMMTADVRSRVEPALKQEAAAILEASGLDLSTAIRLLLRNIVDTGRFPLAVPPPNPKTIAAIKAAKEGKTTSVSLEDL